jgi:aldehyde dehydrogenase (NAD+)
MNAAERIDYLFDKQKEFFQTGKTFPVEFRIEMLKKLKACVLRHENDIAEALKADLGKSKYESYMCETGMALSELSYMIKHTRKFARKHRVHTPLAQFHSVSYTQPTPYGNTLIMSPWNYPFLLTLHPVTDAISAGNTAIVKPSAYSPATAKLVADMIAECFPEEYIAVVMGGREENAHLLEKKFDFVFFTGSQAVGKEVLRHTAEHLTPAVLELGGKSPVIVDSSANIPLTARRVIFGKIINCGQTCVAPDYILCDKTVKDRLITELQKQIAEQLGNDPISNPNYGHIINRKHFDRICSLIDKSKVVCGGISNPETMQIAPTIMDNVTWEDAVMGEEIFGPVLPVMTFDKFEEIYDILKNRPKPLALYMFSTDKAHIDFVTTRISFGGGCVNDTIIHLATDEMGFGGVGESGMGSYHGKAGFDAFSHVKSIVCKKNWIDLPMRYQPYKDFNDKLVHFFLK